MPVFQILGTDGKMHDVEAPEGATYAQAQDFYNKSTTGQLQNKQVGKPVSKGQPAIDYNTLTGEEFLNSIPQDLRSKVKMISEGKYPIGQRFANSPAGSELLTLASQYDPSFDATDFNKRNRTATNFASGVEGRGVRAVNQTLYHMNRLNDSIDKLNNFNSFGRMANPTVNWLEENVAGDTRQGKFRQDVHAVASELRRVFASTGGGGLTELEKWEQDFPLNATKEQQKAYLKEATGLLGGAMQALNDQYTAGMGKAPTTLYNEKSINTLSKISPEVAQELGIYNPDVNKQIKDNQQYNLNANAPQTTSKRVQVGTLPDGTPIYKIQ
jgi:hypothetical protein